MELSEKALELIEEINEYDQHITQLKMLSRYWIPMEDEIESMKSNQSELAVALVKEIT